MREPVAMRQEIEQRKAGHCYELLGACIGMCLYLTLGCYATFLVAYINGWTEPAPVIWVALAGARLEPAFDLVGAGLDDVLRLIKR